MRNARLEDRVKRKKQNTTKSQFKDDVLSLRSLDDYANSKECFFSEQNFSPFRSSPTLSPPISRGDESECEESMFSSTMMMRKRFALPKCLLSKPLGPEKVELLSEEEKRTYNFQKNKYEAMQQKIKKMTRKPAETVITLEDARKLI